MNLKDKVKNLKWGFLLKGLCFIGVLLCFLGILAINNRNEEQICELEKENASLEERLRAKQNIISDKEEEIESYKKLAEDYYWLSYYSNVSTYDGEYEYYE